MAPDIVPQYRAFHLDAARNLIRLVLQDPEDLGSHIKLCVSLFLNPIDMQGLTVHTV